MIYFYSLIIYATYINDLKMKVTSFLLKTVALGLLLVRALIGTFLLLTYLGLVSVGTYLGSCLFASCTS